VTGGSVNPAQGDVDGDVHSNQRRCLHDLRGASG
jgi:hypothetical protein